MLWNAIPCILGEDQLIVLYCIEEVARNYIFNTANSFSLRGRIAHMSFNEKLEERRMILLYDIGDDEAERHQQMSYPLCARGLSCDFTVCTFVI